MSILIQSDAPQDIIGLSVAPKYDRHCQAYREARWLANEKVARVQSRENLEACLSDLIAEYFARRAT